MCLVTDQAQEIRSLILVLYWKQKIVKLVNNVVVFIYTWSWLTHTLQPLYEENMQAFIITASHAAAAQCIQLYWCRSRASRSHQTWEWGIDVTGVSQELKSKATVDTGSVKWNRWKLEDGLFAVFHCPLSVNWYINEKVQLPESVYHYTLINSHALDLIEKSNF